eukprot:gene23440-biopygen14875
MPGIASWAPEHGWEMPGIASWAPKHGWEMPGIPSWAPEHGWEGRDGAALGRVGRCCPAKRQTLRGYHGEQRCIPRYGMPIAALGQSLPRARSTPFLPGTLRSITAGGAALKGGLSLGQRVACRPGRNARGHVPACPRSTAFGSAALPGPGVPPRRRSRAAAPPSGQRFLKPHPNFSRFAAGWSYPCL